MLSEGNKRWFNSPYFLLGGLVILPTIHAASLSWSEYIRLGFVAAGLAYLWFRQNISERTAVYLFAATLIFSLI